MSYAVFFGVLSATCLLAALAALWGSLRAAFGDEASQIEAIAHAPERATLLDEKTSLLRAIKDLHYEYQVGKLDQADFERLDRAYRARAKEVLELLDQDERPYRARAEALLERAVSAVADGPASARRARAVGRFARSGKRKNKARTAVAEPDATAAAENDEGSASASTEALLDKLDALSPEKRAAAEAFLAKLAAETQPGDAPARAAEPQEPGEADDDGGGSSAERDDDAEPPTDRKVSS